MAIVSEQQLHLAGSMTVERDFLGAIAQATAQDAVFAGGSFIEGVGSTDADVEAYAIKDRRPTVAQVDVAALGRVIGRAGVRLDAQDKDADICRIHTTVPGTSIKVDLHFRTWDEVEALAVAVRRLYDLAQHDLLGPAQPLPLRDLLFMHRLFTSQDLHGKGRLARLREDIGLRRFLYLMYRRKACGQLLLAELIRCWTREDWPRCMELAYEAAVGHFQAYTHLLGNTHFHPVWLLPRARRFGVPKAVIDRLVRIMMDRDTTGRAGCRQYVRDCLDFVDDVLAAGAPILRRLDGFPGMHAARMALQAQLERCARPCSPMEEAYRRKTCGLDAPPLRTWLGQHDANVPFALPTPR